jgi:hypothetical protein
LTAMTTATTSKARANSLYRFLCSAAKNLIRSPFASCA